MSANYKKKLINSLQNKQLFLVSNRGPYSFYENSKGHLQKKRGGGGLVTAFLSLVENIDTAWFSLAQSPVDAKIGLDGVAIGPKKRSVLKFVSVSKDLYSRFYNNMCNQILWFVQHNLWDNTYLPVFNYDTDDSWLAYQAVNKKMAEAINSELKTNDKEIVILFQDYHFYLAGKYLKHQQNIKVAHFTHIPWPSSETFSTLPNNIVAEVIEGLLNHDLIGFHSQDYVENFLQCCEQLLDLPIDTNNKKVKFNDRWVPIGAYPISIDALALNRESDRSEVEEHIKFLPKHKFILRADRVDPSKNIIRGFLAFERMLDLFPNLIGEVSFLAYLYESRNELENYRKYLGEIKLVVDKINKKYATKEWRPIKLRLADNYHETLAAYKKFDVLLVNSIADGMNLVAKEGPLLNQKHGVVVLSARTGAFNELSKFCIPVNPFDINQTALSMKEALFMSKEEKAARSRYLKVIITNNDSAKWLYHQMSALA